MHKLTQTGERKVSEFNSCLINRSIGLTVRFNSKNGKFSLRNAEGKLEALTDDFDKIEAKAEILSDRPIRLIQRAA